MDKDYEIIQNISLAEKKEQEAPISENTVSTSNSEQSEQSDSDSGLTSNSETI